MTHFTLGYIFKIHPEEEDDKQEVLPVSGSLETLPYVGYSRKHGIRKEDTVCYV